MEITFVTIDMDREASFRDACSTMGIEILENLQSLNPQWLQFKVGYDFAHNLFHAGVLSEKLHNLKQSFITINS